MNFNIPNTQTLFGNSLRSNDDQARNMWSSFEGWETSKPEASEAMFLDNSLEVYPTSSNTNPNWAYNNPYPMTNNYKHTDMDIENIISDNQYTELRNFNLDQYFDSNQPMQNDNADHGTLPGELKKKFINQNIYGGERPVQSTDSRSSETSLQKGLLKSVKEIPEKYQCLFEEFPYFNIVQSTVFDDVFHSDKCLVVSAPTGSGKTTLMELAMVRLLMQQENSTDEDGFWKKDKSNQKIVYMAPLKAVVAEKYQDWKERLGAFGLKCSEITGDTNHDDFEAFRKSQVILTTPEKWDSLTRRWKDNTILMKAIRLFLIDEVHVLNEEMRGPTLEAVISRMKTIHSTYHQNSSILRIIAVSATIPNVEDVASWLSLGSEPAAFYKLEEKLRPVQLRRVVLGFPCNQAWSDFRFDLSLNYKVASVIYTYSENKPTLVFTSTRKGTQQTALELRKEGRFVSDSSHKEILTAAANGLRDNKLRECVLFGVGFHHAGVDVSDRRALESLFIEGNLPVLVSTSTLAMGVNLPAHLVIVKSTAQYVNGECKEYSTTQLLQMVGRAGRPQFDTSATAVIMTKMHLKEKYELMVSGKDVIESHLHKQLTEHLNAEIVLGTIDDLSVAVEWLRSTFLYVRVQKNPQHYRLSKGLTMKQLEGKLQEWCTKEVNALASNNLIEMDEVCIKPTLAGRLMARYYISFATMKKFLKVEGNESLKGLLEMISGCQEFSDIKLRTSEKRNLNEMNKTKMRFPIKGRVKTTAQKVSCLVQAVFACQPTSDYGLAQEAQKVVRTGQRLAKCLFEYTSIRKEYDLLLNAAILNKVFSCQLWETSKMVSKQLDRIGPTLATALVSANFVSFTDIEKADPRELELICNRQTPFGNRLREQAESLPRYEIAVQQTGKVGDFDCILVVTVTLVNVDNVNGGKTLMGRDHSCILLLGDQSNVVVFAQRVTDASLVQAGGSLTKEISVIRCNDGDEIEVHYLSETFAGLDVESVYAPRYAGPLPWVPHKAAPKEEEEMGNAPKGEVSWNPGRGNSKGGISRSDRRNCLHQCVDKTSCLHKCCKDGIPIKSKSMTKSGPQIDFESKTKFNFKKLKVKNSKPIQVSLEQFNFQVKPKLNLNNQNKVHRISENVDCLLRSENSRKVSAESESNTVLGPSKIGFNFLKKDSPHKVKISENLEKVKNRVCFDEYLPTNDSDGCIQHTNKSHEIDVKSQSRSVLNNAKTQPPKKLQNLEEKDQCVSNNVPDIQLPATAAPLDLNKSDPSSDETASKINTPVNLLAQTLRTRLNSSHSFNTQKPFIKPFGTNLSELQRSKSPHKLHNASQPCLSGQQNQQNLLNNTLNTSLNYTGSGKPIAGVRPSLKSNLPLDKKSSSYLEFKEKIATMANPQKSTYRPDQPELISLKIPKKTNPVPGAFAQFLAEREKEQQQLKSLYSNVPKNSKLDGGYIQNENSTTIQAPNNPRMGGGFIQNQNPITIQDQSNPRLSVGYIQNLNPKMIPVSQNVQMDEGYIQNQNPTSNQAPSSPRPNQATVNSRLSVGYIQNPNPKMILLPQNVQIEEGFIQNQNPITAQAPNNPRLNVGYIQNPNHPKMIPISQNIRMDEGFIQNQNPITIPVQKYPRLNDELIQNQNPKMIPIPSYAPQPNSNSSPYFSSFNRQDNLNQYQNMPGVSNVQQYPHRGQFTNHGDGNGLLWSSQTDLAYPGFSLNSIPGRDALQDMTLSKNQLAKDNSDSKSNIRGILKSKNDGGVSGGKNIFEGIL